MNAKVESMNVDVTVELVTYKSLCARVCEVGRTASMAM